jgi:diguanylate cyclase (GGDEF)-like protein
MISGETMKIFLDRHKTLLPRIDVIYLLTRIMTLAGIGWFVVFGDYPETDATLFQYIAASFILQLIIFYLGMRNKFDIKAAYLLAITYDIIFIPVFIYYTGGVTSSFYLLNYLTISVAAYVLRFSAATVVTAISSILYLLIVWPDLNFVNGFGVSMRIGFVWVFFLAISYASEYMRRSERRLLKLFDTLNQRTSELEKFQAQLEVVYENTRALTAMLDVDGLVREVTRILGKILGYRYYAMILRDKDDHFYFRARKAGKSTSFHLKAIDMSKMELVARVCKSDEAIRISNSAGRDDYIHLSDKPGSLLIAPLLAHGQNKGVLIAEDEKKDAFSERHLQMLSTVARSAALALENAELHRRTEELTLNDELTQTFNYRYFVQKLQEEKRRALRYELPLSLIMVDIDWFKKLNDSYGHEVGNIVLQQLSKVIKSCIRDVDIFARYGGEEFAIILPQTPQSEAVHIGERIREQVENETIQIDEDKQTKITVSVGISSFPENGKSQEELVSIADQALYRAKGEGRNLVCVI